MTRAVYVILTHRDWAQVRRLAGAILASSPGSRVVIMHDGRRERFPQSDSDDRVEIVEHGLATDWGSWEMVEATLRGFRHARRHNPELVALISGQDYPIRPLEAWEEEVLAASSWIGEARPLHYLPRWGRCRGEGDDRWTRYGYRWFRSPFEVVGVRLPPTFDRLWRRIRGAVTLRVEPIVAVRIVTRGRGTHYGIRRWPSPFSAARPCWFGAQWVALRRAELDRILDVDLAPRSRLWKLYRRSIIPDESALVTPLSWMRTAADIPPLTQQRWDDASDTGLTWTADDIEELVRSGSAFCRKVDRTASTALMNLLDDRTAREGGRTT